MPTGRVDLVVCRGCGLIFNATFDPARAEIGARYESSQAASAHFSHFARSLAQAWIARHNLAGRSVLEIGCGQGDFLRLLLEQGVGNALGLDPLAPTTFEPQIAGLQMRAQAFDSTALGSPGDAAVCRHTLEHIQPVRAFLHLLVQWARRDTHRVVLFELPATERLLSERAFWDVYYEHCNYFTAASLVHAFNAAGFDVIRHERVYDDQYLILEARARVGGAAPRHRPLDAVVEACLQFGRDVRDTVHRCDARLEQMAAMGGPIVLWQGAAKTVGFVSAIERHKLIHSAVDLSPRRQGRYLPGSGLAVRAPDELTRIAPSHVILMNPVYVNEVQASLDQLGVTAKLLTINELCAPDT